MGVMGAAHRGAISFGLVHIPISLYTATQDSDITFNQLHNVDQQRIRYKKVCRHCGKEVSESDIVRGFEYAKDQYVVVTDDDFEKIKTEKDKSIHILHFVDFNQISPIYYDKSYHAVPEVGAEKAFELLRKAMMDMQKIAIGKTVLGTKEALIAIMPHEEGLLILKMFFENEVRGIPRRINKVEIEPEAMSWGGKLIKAMDIPFEPTLYKDEYRERLKAVIAQKIAGKEIVSAPKEPPVPAIDLIEALKRSVVQHNDAVKKSADVAKSRKQAILK